MSSNTWQGKVALVIGGARGIGRAICERLAREGLHVAINYRTSRDDAERTAEACRKLEVQAVAIQADVANREQVVAMVEQVRQQLGPIDVLVNNAGIFDLVPHEETTPKVWQSALDTNLTGAYHTIWAVKEEMIQRRFGRIVNVSSVAGLQARSRCIAYSVSKAGLVMLTKSFSEAVAEHNVRVNCVAPGLIDTEMPRVAGDERLREMVEATPLKRIGQPRDIANVAWFLISDESDFMTGQTVVASGGRVLLG